MTQKLNHLFNNNKCQCLFLMYTKQLSTSWGVCWSLDCQICTLSKIKKRLLKKEKVKGFFIFMTILSFKQVEYKYSKKKPCKQGCSSIIKFSHCLSFEYCKYCFEKISEVNKCGKAIFWQSWRLKIQKFLLGMNHGYASQRKWH